MQKIKKIDIFNNFNGKYIMQGNICISLKKQFGLNFGKSKKIINNLGYNKKTEFCYLKKKNILNTFNIFLKKYKINKYYLLNFLYFRLKRYININSRKGRRHILNLTIRGQRSHTNKDTQKKINRIFILHKIFQDLIPVYIYETIFNKNKKDKTFKKKKNKK
jgi:ribosomal protein S13